jgi:hypothetical protein
MLSKPCIVLDRPRGLLKFEAPRISRQSAHEGGKVISPTHRPTLPPKSFISVRTKSTPGPDFGQKFEVHENTNDPIGNKTRVHSACSIDLSVYSFTPYGTVVTIYTTRCNKNCTFHTYNVLMCVVRRGCFVTYGWNGLCCQRRIRVFTGTVKLSFSAFLRLLVPRAGTLDICCTNTGGVEKRRQCNTKSFHKTLFHFWITFVVYSFNTNKDSSYLNYSFVVQGIKMSGNHQMSAKFVSAVWTLLKEMSEIRGLN